MSLARGGAVKPPPRPSRLTHRRFVCPVDPRYTGRGRYLTGVCSDKPLPQWREAAMAWARSETPRPGATLTNGAGTALGSIHFGSTGVCEQLRGGDAHAGQPALRLHSLGSDGVAIYVSFGWLCRAVLVKGSWRDMCAH